MALSEDRSYKDRRIRAQSKQIVELIHERNTMRDQRDENRRSLQSWKGQADRVRLKLDDTKAQLKTADAIVEIDVSTIDRLGYIIKNLEGEVKELNQGIEALTAQGYSLKNQRNCARKGAAKLVELRRGDIERMDRDAATIAKLDKQFVEEEKAHKQAVDEAWRWHRKWLAAVDETDTVRGTLAAIREALSLLMGDS